MNKILRLLLKGITAPWVSYAEAYAIGYKNGSDDVKTRIRKVLMEEKK